MMHTELSLEADPLSKGGPPLAFINKGDVPLEFSNIQPTQAKGGSPFTPSIAEIICVKNMGEIAVCGFFIR